MTRAPTPASPIEVGPHEAADIEVMDRELRLTLAPMSSAHKTRAIAALCEQLNESATVSPGSNLRVRYAIGDAS